MNELSNLQWFGIGLMVVGFIGVIVLSIIHFVDKSSTYKIYEVSKDTVQKANLDEDNIVNKRIQKSIEKLRGVYKEEGQLFLTTYYNSDPDSDEEHPYAYHIMNDRVRMFTTYLDGLGNVKIKKYKEFYFEKNSFAEFYKYLQDTNFYEGEIINQKQIKQIVDLVIDKFKTPELTNHIDGVHDNLAAYYNSNLIKKIDEEPTTPSGVDAFFKYNRTGPNRNVIECDDRILHLIKYSLDNVDNENMDDIILTDDLLMLMKG